MINDFRGEYSFLSNFYNCDIEYEGLVYKNSEAAFQASKSLDIEIRKQFTNLNPGEAKKLGRRIKLRSDWEKVKDKIMYDVCYEKFIQNKDLLEKLLNTNNELLVEGNTWHDNYWGICSCDKCKKNRVTNHGNNQLGEILMMVRYNIKKEMEDKMNKYSEIIKDLEHIIANKLDTKDDYEVVELFNKLINYIKLCSGNNSSFN